LSDDLSTDIILPVNRVRIVIASVLLVLWPGVTSHALLQRLELIHEFHHDHDGGGGSHEHDSDDDHEFADGGYLNSSGGVSVLKTLLAESEHCFAATLPLAPLNLNSAVFNSGLAPPEAAPLELLHSWQFSFRAALPARAPSVVF
jgi:hypothetical protein